MNQTCSLPLQLSSAIARAKLVLREHSRLPQDGHPILDEEFNTVLRTFNKNLVTSSTCAARCMRTGGWRQTLKRLGYWRNSRSGRSQKRPSKACASQISDNYSLARIPEDFNGRP